LELTKPGRATGNPVILAASSRSEYLPAFSPNGERIAFVSTRSGSAEIWVSDADGSSPLMLTSTPGKFTEAPVWSPDGERIAYTCILNGDAEVYVISASGGTPVRVTRGKESGIAVSWSADGKWLYYISGFEGESSTRKILVEGEESLTIAGVHGIPVEKSPGVTLIFYWEYLRHEHFGLWKLDIEKDERTRILDTMFRGNFAIADQGVYFIGERDQKCGCYHLQYIDLASRQVSTIVDIDDVGKGLAVSPDGRSIVYTETTRASGDIMLAEDFM
jgi:Tol biopolymer transport system component